MNRLFLTILPLLIAFLPVNAEISFNGNQFDAFKADVPASTGLSTVYVLHDTDNTSIVYNASGSSVEISSFGNMGAAYGTPVDFNRNGNTCTFAIGNDDRGFAITDNGRTQYFYIINYSNHQLSLDRLDRNSDDSDCARVALTLQGNAAPIYYYSTTGRRMELSRNLELTYSTLVYDENSETFISTANTETINSSNGTIHASQPLCPTDFTLSGDRFLKAWDMTMEVTSDYYEPTAVDARTTAIQTNRDVDNEQKVEANLGGSAPVDITFDAAVTDAAVFREWQFSKDAEFNLIDLRFNDTHVEYTFREAGTTYVRFIAANADATCEYISDTYEVFIGESRLECPNAFSPGSTPGINDLWKVSYRSITTFECHIFNRWGVKVASLTDPSQGWDGRHNGKLVPAGVYYYVIKATGADGHNYKLSGDINILNSRESNRQSSTEE